MKQKKILFALLIAFTSLNIFPQVGIGTTTPDASSILDLTSTTQGVLTPRMTTLQRTTISSPVKGLLVFDLELNAFYFYDGTDWVALETNSSRDNHVVVKSEADFPAPSGGVITLNTNTLYEINGQITLANSIDLNGAYVIGVDTNEDKLVRVGGTIFEGVKGGSLRNLTLSAPGGTVFNINAGSTENFVLQSSIVANSGSVGSLEGFNLVFMNIIQYAGNTNGIIYKNINDLLLSNQGWFSNNSGTYETIEGTFSLIQKVSGFSDVTGTNIGLDVSLNPIVNDGVISGTVFTGNGVHVAGYSPAQYIDFYFSNKWSIDSPGLTTEKDAVATGTIYLTGTPVETVITSADTPVKVSGITSTVNLFRVDGGISNRLVYKGIKTRVFTISGSFSMSGGNNSDIAFYIYKNGAQLPSTKILRKIGSGGDIGAAAISGTVKLETDDYIELWVENQTNTNNVTLEVLNLYIK